MLSPACSPSLPPSPEVAGRVRLRGARRGAGAGWPECACPCHLGTEKNASAFCLWEVLFFPLFCTVWSSGGEGSCKRLSALGEYLSCWWPGYWLWTPGFPTELCFCFVKGQFIGDNPHYDSLSSRHVLRDTLTRSQDCYQESLLWLK